MNASLKTLLNDCAAGNAGAVATLVRSYRPQALREAVRLLGDPALAEDAVQEAFAAALDRLGELRDPVAFPAWLRRIVRTHALRILRKERELPLADAGESVMTEPVAPRRLEEEEHRQAVREALNALPESGRATAELFYLEERSCAEVARLLRVPEGTVKRRLHDVRRRLRGMLLGHVGHEPPRSTNRNERNRRTPL